MRSSRLAAAVERANKATESMRQLTLIAAVLAAVYICAPYILALRRQRDEHRSHADEPPEAT